MKNSLERKLNTRQYRNMEPLEIRAEAENAESSFLVQGYAMKYAPYKLYEDLEGEPVYEEFTREAFEYADKSDVIFLYDHQGKVFARSSNETLRVTFDDEGMFVEADLSKSKAAREMFDEIKAGLVTKMSWGFMPGDYEYDEEKRTIVHKSIKKVYDVSAVGIPANNDTSINARKFANGVIGEFETERSKVRRARMLLNLEIELLKE